MAASLKRYKKAAPSHHNLLERQEREAMDTVSHLLFGATLAGMAHLQPEVAADPALSAAILTAALIGSHAPDFDSALRLKGPDAYVKHHRGFSHSIPALLVWPLLIGGPSSWLWGAGEHAALVCAWTFAAVVLHVLFDLTNAYGVQCLWPFRRKWLHLDALCLTDIALVLLHGIAAGGWALGVWADPGAVCLAAWVATAVYAVWRTVHHAIVVRRVKRRFGRPLAVHVLPGLWWFNWQYVVQADTGEFHLGVIQGRRMLPFDTLPKPQDAEEHACVRVSRGTANVQALLRFAKRVYVKWQAQQDGGFLVTWTDLRFWRDKDWPFRAEVRLDDKLNVVEQRIGWHKKAWEPPYV